MCPKFLVSLLFLGFFACNAGAEKATISDVPTDQDTTITIRKGDKAVKKEKCDPIYEIVENAATVTGDAALMDKDAKANWKKSCDSWKKEVKDLTKGEKLLSLDCGEPNCKLEGSDGKACSSKATYKLKSSLSN